jgi:hypothetical protein
MMMHHNRQVCGLACESQTATAALVLLIVFATVVIITPAAKAQTFTVLHDFTDGNDGALLGQA